MAASTLLTLMTTLLMLLGQGVGGELHDEQELRKAILADYDKHSKPNKTNTIHIIKVSVQNFDMHEADHQLEVTMWLGFKWQDPRLAWNAGDHGNIKKIGVDPDLLWKPDLTIYNAANPTNQNMKAEYPIHLSEDGTIIHVPALHMHFTCVMDLTYWPYDSHNCSLKVGSWVHDAFQIELDVTHAVVENEVAHQVGAGGKNLSLSSWELVEATVERQEKIYSCCDEPYVSLHISALLTRNAPAYCWTIKLPVVCLTLLTLVMFLLPPGAGEKITFGGLCLILDTLFLKHTGKVVDYAPSHTPLIVELVSQQLVLVTVSVLVTALVVRLARDPHSSPLPQVLKKPVLTLSSFLCLSNYSRLVSSGRAGISSNGPKSDEVELGDDGTGGDLGRGYSNQWLLMAAVIDRLFFILYLTICVISLIRFSCVL